MAAKDLVFSSGFGTLSKASKRRKSSKHPRTVHRMTAKKEKWAQEGSEFTTSITRGDASKVWGPGRSPNEIPSGNMAIDNGPVELGSFPNKSGGSFHSCVSVYQRVDLFHQCHDSWIFAHPPRHRSAWWNLWPPLMWMCCRG